MMSETWPQIIEIQNLPNIARSKDNQTKAFGQLIKYSMKAIFRQKTIQKSSHGN